jgi:hypothetical protein
MKLKLPLALAALSLSCATIHAQQQQQPLEQPLTNWPSQDGQNFQVGQLACPLSVQGLNIHGSSGTVTASIPLLTDPASAGVAIGDTLYALIPPPDGNTPATALVMYQAGNSADPSTIDEVNKAVQDALNHNNLFGANYVIGNMSVGESLPAGTQFWVCSSTGFVTLTGNGSISVAGQSVPTVDPTDPEITDLASLVAGGQ